jgi:hypothetical protein
LNFRVLVGVVVVEHHVQLAAGVGLRDLFHEREELGLAVTFVAAVGDPLGGDLERRQHDSRLEDVSCCRVNLSNPTNSSSAAAVSTNSRMLTDQCSRLPSGSIASTNGVDRSTKPRAPPTSSIGGNAPSRLRSVVLRDDLVDQPPYGQRLVRRIAATCQPRSRRRYANAP